MHYLIFAFAWLYLWPSLLAPSQITTVRDSGISDSFMQSPQIHKDWFMGTHIFSKSFDSHIYIYILVLYTCINDLMTLFHNHYLIMALPITSSSKPASQPLTFHWVPYINILKLMLNVQRVIRCGLCTSVTYFNSSYT